MAGTITNQTELNKYLSLYNQPRTELQQMAKELTLKNFGPKAEFCSIISAKTGKCPEDCTYCAQSSHYRTQCTPHELVTLETVLNAARDARNNGATRFCVVTSGKGIENDSEFDKILEMVNAVSKIDGLHSCCSLGIVNSEQAKALKDAGLERFNHNLNSARSFYNNICTTHSFEERVETISNLSNAGIEVCCGGIIGMGETREQRIEMALQLRELNPTSVPLNFLHPIAGTPMEDIKKLLTIEEILKTIAIYRIILPRAFIRYAGGRTFYLDTEQQLEGIKSGINAMLVGNYLTTTGTSPEQDQELLKQAGLELIED